MRFLFIVQGEGRGHLTQALALEEMLTRNGHEIVEVLVGRNSTRRLPGFFNRNIQAPVKRFISPYHPYMDENDRADVKKGIFTNLSLIPEYYRSICYINKRIEASKADVVINFYELLTGLTYTLFNPSIPYIAVGHQYLFLHNDFDAPQESLYQQYIMKLYAKLSSHNSLKRLALSYTNGRPDNSENIEIIPPLLRGEVTSMIPEDGEYIQGYMLLNRYANEIQDFHAMHPDIALHFFWDNVEADDVTQIDKNLTYHQIDDVKFLDLMAKCKAYATTAGFESICEAMYLGKPVQMIPVHIEQQFNAADASRSGAGIVSDHFDIDELMKFAESYEVNQEFIYWVRSSERRVLELFEKLINHRTADEADSIANCIPA